MNTIFKILMSTLMLVSQAQAQSPSIAASPESAPTAADGSSQGVVSAPKPIVLSFVEWKSLRVHEAQQKLEQVSNSQTAGQIAPTEKFAGSDKATERLNFNVDVALQLNIQDYFSMYLKNLSKEEFKEATKKMNQDEVSELLLAYKSTQETSKGPGLKFSKSEKR